MSEKTDSKTVLLPASFTEKTIDGVLEAVNECSAAGLAFTIDGSEVERVDSAALQALVFCLMPVDTEAAEACEFVASDLLAMACQTAGVAGARPA